jgi:hydrogenase expression/formation protein HypE
VGWLPPGRRVDPASSAPGDAVLLSGTVGDHGITVLAARGDLGLEPGLSSDAAAVHDLVEGLFAAGVAPRALRDPTRGGLAGVVHELARAAGVAMEIDEASIPVHPRVAAACDLLGLDPLYVANEGKVVAVVPASQADRAVAAWREHPLGRNAARIGRVLGGGKPGTALLRTAFGGRRVLPVLSGDQLPRIC